MILDHSQTIFVNGVKDPDIYCMGQKIWPMHSTTVEGYWITIMWDPSKTENICIDGMWWDGIAIAQAEVAGSSSAPEAFYRNGSSWDGLTWSEVNEMLDNDGNSLSKYCKGYTLKVLITSFSSFQFKTDQYYQPSGTVTVEIEEAYDDGTSVLVASKTCTMAANTTYTINNGDTI